MVLGFWVLHFGLYFFVFEHLILGSLVFVVFILNLELEFIGFRFLIFWFILYMFLTGAWHLDLDSHMVTGL